MHAQVVQCLLAVSSLLYYLPAAVMSRSVVHLAPDSPSMTATRCSLDDLVSRLTLEQVARIVSGWSLKEGVSPIRVLHLLENGVAASDQLHVSMPASASTAHDYEQGRFLGSPPPPPPSTLQHRPISSMPPSDGQLPLLVMHHLPAGGHGLLPQPPQLPSSSSSGIRMPASFPFLPPPFNPAARSDPFRLHQMPPPTMPFGTLLPPPDAIVRIEDSVYGTRFPEVPVTVVPSMPITEALIQASKSEAENSLLNGQSNGLKVTWGQKQTGASRCLVVRTIGDLDSRDDGDVIWEVIVQDRTGEEMWKDVCLPSLADIHVRPGMIITFNYVKHDDL